jgi:hypothetical protein
MISWSGLRLQSRTGFYFRCWSIAGTSFDEMFATLLPVGSWLPTTAMEEVDRKFLPPVTLQPGYRQRHAKDLCRKLSTLANTCIKRDIIQIDIYL